MVSVARAERSAPAGCAVEARGIAGAVARAEVLAAVCRAVFAVAEWGMGAVGKAPHTDAGPAQSASASNSMRKRAIIL